MLLIGLLAGIAAAIQVSAIGSLVLTGWLPARLPDFRGLAELNPNPAVVLGLGVISVLLLLVLAFFVLPRRYVRNLPDLGPPPEGDRISLKDQVTIRADQEKRRNDLRTGALQAIGGLALIFALLTTLLQLQANQRQANEQQDLTRRGQIADRFSKAIDQLGNQNNLDVRLGGIYALEQIARDSRDDQTRLATYEVLTAYVRDHAVWDPGRVPLGPTSQIQSRAPDVQAVVTALGRRVFFKADPALNLVGVDLETMSLAGGHFERASLRSAHLHRAFLNQGHFEDAYLNDLDLQDAFARAVHLEGANLPSGHLERSQLDFAHLERTYLGLAHLEGANLQEARLEGANLQEARLEGANLYGAHLEGTILFGAHLAGAHLENARLQGAIAARDTTWPSGFDWRAAGVVMR